MTVENELFIQHLEERKEDLAEEQKQRVQTLRTFLETKNVDQTIVRRQAQAIEKIAIKIEEIETIQRHAKRRYK